ncbi:His-Xaa-Ser system protein HxsD [Pseudomonas azerbaijanoccidens]|uniref:His-Xaa-Ser system protein HxsD n=1 Tax=Pseudomonas azerbaijanoccidentalis TaxID=2842347 RepID=UPI00200A03FD|nr:His-Xaa-Ser system protein HxsD [Pseudomonas azerbaijanoccidentalis]MCK8664867.1 His-Xaa-Ser system protein HxsD [Pseudomonas azerbaijanoccidentalis]
MNGFEKMSWEVTVSVDSVIYPLSVVQRASYALAPTLMIQIRQIENLIHLDAAPTLLAGGAGAVTSAQKARELILRNLNDFALRAQIQHETSGLREILATAALRGAGI